MSVLAVLAAISAAAAVAVLVRPAPTTLLDRLVTRRGPDAVHDPAHSGPAPSPRDNERAATQLLARFSRRHTLLLVGTGCGLGILVHSPVPIAGAVLAGAVFIRRRRRRSARDAERARRTAVIELCSALSAELRAGRAPRDALIRAASGTASVAALCPTAVTAAQSAGDVPAALIASGTDGATSLRWLAACWRVAEEQGAGLAAAAERLAEQAHADEALRQEVSTHLASPRATAVLLAVLPVVGVLLGTGLGAAPLDFLLRTPWGMCCLVLGTLLAAAGVVWTERIAHRAEKVA